MNNYNYKNCNIISCNKCDISINNKIVNGEGSLNSKLMIIGEAPGYMEQKHGVPFIGNSGKLLTTMLNLIGLNRNSVYLTNIIKCRPPNNNTPTAIEIANCRPYLLREIESVNPKIVLLLGGTALNAYFGVSGLNVGRVRTYVIPRDKRLIVTTYHPAYILRNSTERNLKMYTYDFKLVSILYKYFVNPLITTSI